VLLYELLTSRTPFDAATLLKAGLEQMRRIIREQEPQRPSARLSTLEAADLTTIATHRRAEPPKLLSILRGDLDWIVMKALEKDRTRRYETASALATDIQRHLSNETIIARPPSASYRVQKFLRRNKAALGLASAILFLATALLVITFLLLKEFQLGKYTGISINSNPQGAEVWHGGEMLGYTPFVKKGLPPGEFTYVLVLAKFETSSNSTILLPKLHMNDITFLRPVGHGGTETAAGSSTNVTEIAAPVSLSASIVMIQGSVEFSTKESSRWVIAQTDMVLGPGSQLRTASNSLAKLRFEKSTITINENSVLEIPVQGTNNIDGSKSIIIRTKGAVAAIRG
jgi:hypothetical protein